MPRIQNENLVGLKHDGNVRSKNQRRLVAAKKPTRIIDCREGGRTRKTEKILIFNTSKRSGYKIDQSKKVLRLPARMEAKYIDHGKSELVISGDLEKVEDEPLWVESTRVEFKAIDNTLPIKRQIKDIAQSVDGVVMVRGLCICRNEQGCGGITREGLGEFLRNVEDVLCDTYEANAYFSLDCTLESLPPEWIKQISEFNFKSRRFRAFFTEEGNYLSGLNLIKTTTA